jgi:predicted Zn-dependent protease
MMEVKPLPVPDSFCLSAAQGWLELGNHREAFLELSALSPELEGHPQVLEVRWEIYAQTKEWQSAVAAASRLTEVLPQYALGWVHLAFSLHELKQTVAARDVLLPVVENFPRDGLMRYNLACYACQLGDVTDAEAWLVRAMKIMGKKEVQLMAQSDPDLLPLRERLLQL